MIRNHSTQSATPHTPNIPHIVTHRKKTLETLGIKWQYKAVGIIQPTPHPIKKRFGK